MLSSSRGLLEPQGYTFLLPPPGSRVVADVAVMPLPGSPEWAAYRSTRIDARGVVSERDPWLALALAVAYPKRGFTRLLVGVDPGGSCGVSAVADGVVIYTGKAPCSQVGGLVSWITSWVPHSRLSVYIGTGPGYPEASLSLEEAGVPYMEADESETSDPAVPGLARHAWKDRDLRASTLIALLGAYRRGGRS
ncbi:hypothetical protein [Stetteria hydrogenophila]